MVAAISPIGVFSPTDISGLQLWLDADDASTITLNGSNVSQWNDKSGNARNFDQGTAANQPARTLSAQNGKTALTFATNDFLKNTALNWGASNSTLFLVMKEDDTEQGFQNVFTTGTGATGQWSYGINANFVNNRYSIFDIGEAHTAFNFSPTGTNADVVCFTTAGVSSGSVTANLFRNGTADTGNPKTQTTTTSAAGAQLGANSTGAEAYRGTICEVILYDSQLSTTDRNKVEDYLKTKWATP